MRENEESKKTNPILSEEEIRNIIDSNSETIKKKIDDTITNAVIDKLTWKLQYEVEEVTKEFFDEEIRPEIKKLLLQNKDVIIQEVSKASVEVATLLTSTLVEKATKNMSGYSGTDILKKLFT